MNFLPGNILAAALSQYYLQFLPQFIYRMHAIHIECNYRAFSPVYLNITFLLQNRICLIYCMHIDPDRIRQLAHAGQRISFMKL